MRALGLAVVAVVCFGGLIGFLMWQRFPEARVAEEVVNNEQVSPERTSALAGKAPPRVDDAGTVEPAVVDLEVVRTALPDNRYWEEQAPTTDPTVLQRRAESRARREAQHGRILAGTATNDEIDAYFAERERISKDAIAFAQYVLTTFGNGLSQQERGLYTLAIDMNGKRLEDLPRDKAEAHSRKSRQDQARADWQR